MFASSISRQIVGASEKCQLTLETLLQSDHNLLFSVRFQQQPKEGGRTKLRQGAQGPATGEGGK